MSKPSQQPREMRIDEMSPQEPTGDPLTAKRCFERLVELGFDSPAKLTRGLRATRAKSEFGPVLKYLKSIDNGVFPKVEKGGAA